MVFKKKLYSRDYSEVWNEKLTGIKNSINNSVTELIPKQYHVNTYFLLFPAKKFVCHCKLFP